MPNPALDNLFSTLPTGPSVGAALSPRTDSGDGFGDILKHAGQGTSISTNNDSSSQRDDQNQLGSGQQSDDDRAAIGSWRDDTNDLPSRDSTARSDSADDYTDHWRPSQPSNSQPESKPLATGSASDLPREINQRHASDRSTNDRAADRTAKADNAKDRQSGDENGPAKPAANADASRAAGSTNPGPVKPAPTDKDFKKAAAAVAEETESADGEQKQAATAEQTKAAQATADQAIHSTPASTELPGTTNNGSLKTNAEAGVALQTKSDSAANPSAAKADVKVKAADQKTAQTQQENDANLVATQNSQGQAIGSSSNAASVGAGSQAAPAGKQFGKANCETGNTGGTPPLRPLRSGDDSSDPSQQANSVEASWASAVAQATALPAGTLQLQVPFATTSESKPAETKSNSSTDAIANQPAAVPADRGAANVPAADNNQIAAANSPVKLSTDDRAGQAVIGPPRSAASQIDQVRFVQRVARAFRAADEQGGEIKLRLSPPELGSLKVEIAIRNGVMTARLEAETTTARSLLVDNLPTLRARLADQNIKIERFDVDLKQDGRGDGSANLPSDAGGSRQGTWRGQPVLRSGAAGSQPLGVGTTAGAPSSTRANDGQINVVI